MLNCLRYVLAICVAITLHFTVSSQSLSVNTSGAPAHASAILDVESTAKGMLVPRMTKAQKNAIAAPANGLLVYQSGPDSIGFHYYDLPNTTWVFINASGYATDTTAWRTTGNTGLVDASSFFGNTDNVPLTFRSNNEKVGRLDRSRWNYSFGRGAGNDLGLGHVAFGDSAGASLSNSQPGVFIGYRAGVRSIGNNNTFVGSWAGEATTTGQGNAFFGTTAGIRNTTGGNNAFLGHFAAYNNTTGAGNTAVGSQALLNDTTGSLNVAVGFQSMYLTRNANENTAVGSYSLYSHKMNPWNVAVGEYALFADTAGVSNAALGTSALRFNIDGDQNTAIGTNALMNHVRGDLNTAVGYQAMESDSAGALNVAMGWRALRNNSTGVENTALGVGALEFDSTGNWNTGVGRYAGFGNKRGDLNNFMGYAAAYASDTATLTTFLGSYSGYYNKNDFNTGVGAYSLTHNNFTSGASTTGIENTGIGYGAGYLINLGSKNTAVGHQSMRGWSAYISGNRNVAIGDSAMTFITSGSDNVAVGANAMVSILSSYGNVAVGGNSLHNNTTSVRNVAVGDSAMFTQSYSNGNYLADNTAVGSKAMFYNQPISTGTGVKNTAVGSEAMYFNTTGNQNTVMGVSALRENTTGSGNTVIGRSANRLAKTGNWNSYYGFEAAYSDSAGSDNIAVGFRPSYQNDTASATIALGTESLYYNTVDSNIAIGYRAGFFANSFQQYTSKEQTFIGIHAGMGSFVSSHNTAVGFWALNQFNPATGQWTDYNNGGRNTAIGDSAMGATIGAFNVAVGSAALSNGRLNTLRNVAIGDSAMGNAASPMDNVGIGYKSLSQISNHGNTAVGAYSMQRGDNTIWNTAIGYHALETDTSGSENTVIGTSAFRNTANGIRNVSVGINTGYWSTSSNNTYIGSYAGEGASGLSTGGSNTAVGDFALQDITSGNQNVAMGSSALTLNTGGAGNTAIGYLSGNTNTTGTVNTLLGFNTDVSSSGLTNATAIGAYALAAQNNSVVLGSISGVNSAATTASVGIGTNTPGGRLHVRRNGASGGAYIANASILVEDNTNSFIHLTNPTANENGILSGNAATAIRAGLVFGNDSTIFLRAGGNSNKMIIDNTGFIGAGPSAVYPLTQFHLYDNQTRNLNMRIASQGTSYEPGLELVKTAGGSDWKVRTSTAGFLVFSRSGDDFATSTDEYQMATTSFIPSTDANSTLGAAANRWTTVYATVGAINTSDARDKENVTDLDYGLKEVMKLRPVSFNWKENPQWGKKIGFIAQEVQPILNEVVQVGDLNSKIPQKDDNGNTVNAGTDKLGIYYSDIIPVAVKAIQEQQKIIEDLKKKNEQLEKDMQAIKAKLGINN